ncbi:Hypothetical protein A7982_10885 [Minicystis rosea]|nr:Hypothetical protein A7982_10885 [Minicystis rosea]
MGLIKAGRSGRWLVIAAVSAITAAEGCGSDGGNTGGAGGSGGATSSSTTTTSSSTTSSSTTSSTTSSSSTGTGGAPAVTCLDASTYAGLFTIADTSFCAVAVYEADEEVGYQLPTWGTHGGPLVLLPGDNGDVLLHRWTAPSGSTGKLTKQETVVAAKIPENAFLGGQAVDLPFFGWTGITWTGAFPDTVGEIIMINGSNVAHSYGVNGAFSLAGVGDANGGRLLFTGLSPIGETNTDVNGFYAADACNTPNQDLGTGTGCKASAEIAAWGESSGPVAVDHDGNAFVINGSFSTSDQEARGYAAAEVARGAAATAGKTLFSIPGFGSSLAAITPKGGKPGLLVFQPFDSTTYAPLDVIAQPYTVSTSVASQGTPAKLLTVPATATMGLYMMTDTSDRLWVASSGDSKTTFVVLDRKP